MLLIVKGTAIEAGNQNIDLPIRALRLNGSATMLVVMKRCKLNANSHQLNAVYLRAWRSNSFGIIEGQNKARSYACG